jgi:hypothetical protein
MMCITMNKRTRVQVGVAASALCMWALASCGGEAKPAESPGTCPEGTVLAGVDCIPASAANAKPSDDDWPKESTKHDDKPSASTSQQPAAPSEAPSPSPSDVAASYDKDAVEAQLRRAAKQVKENCGAASDEDGNKPGPWGKTAATVVLGRNGHVQDVTVPAPYNGKPVGDCVVRSFKKIQFPPYPGSSDVSVSWDVEIVQPKHK